MNLESLPSSTVFLLGFLAGSKKDFILEIARKSFENPSRLPWILLLLTWISYGVKKKVHRFWGKDLNQVATVKPGSVITSSRSRHRSTVKKIPAEGEQVQDQDKENIENLSLLPLEQIVQQAKTDAQKLPPVTHRMPQINNGIALFHKVLPMEAGWVTNAEKENVSISLLTIEGLELPFIRGDSLITGGFTMQEVLSVIQNASARKVWDARFDQSTVLEYLSTTSFLIHSIQKGTFPVAPRDFLTATSTYFKDPKSLHYVVTSVQDSAGPAPNSNGCVRAEILVAAWSLSQTEKGVQATYLVHVDVKGYVPSSVIKAVQSSTPLCIANINKFLLEKGPMPFLLMSPSFAPHPLIQFTKRESSQGLVLLDYSIPSKVFEVVVGTKDEKPSKPNQSAITLALPATLFSAGVAISMTGNNSNFHAALVPKPFPCDVSAATAFLVQIWTDPVPETVALSLKATPATDGQVTLNGLSI